MKVADTLNLTGTPSYVVGDEAVVGAVGLDQLKTKVEAMSKCGKTICLQLSRPKNLVGAGFERPGEFSEGGVEHAAHQRRQRPAAEFIGDEEVDRQ